MNIPTDGSYIDTIEEEGDAQIQPPKVTGLLGSELPGIEVWMTVSNKNLSLHDTGKTPGEAERAFTNRTGIAWRDAVEMGWKMVRANAFYKVTAELIE